jgi:hypothetical protein
VTELTHRSRIAMGAHTGKGKELCDLLRRELSIPDGVKSFEVRFAVDEVITVRCEYVPKEEAPGEG